MKQETVLILGAGPAGIGAAYELDKAGKPFTVIEKNDRVGGLSRTFEYGEFRTDLGPHRFYSKNRYLYDVAEELLGESWKKVQRLTRFYVNGIFFLYPVELKSALRSVGLKKAFAILADYLLEQSKKMFNKTKPASFEEQVVSDFGRTLAELNLLNYTEKIWGLPCSEISPDWAKQRIKGLSLKEVMKKALMKSKEGPKTLADEFHYPDSGSGVLFEKIGEKIQKGCGMLKLNSYPTKILHDGSTIGEVIVNIEGHSQAMQPEHVISSIPVTEFLSLLEPPVPEEVSRAAGRLRFRSHVSLFLTVDRPSIFPDQWIYFPDKEIPFGRIMEPKNFSRKMSPENKTSLLLEFFCWEDDRIWRADRNELLDSSIGWLEKFEFIRRKDVIDFHVNREKHAYPVYDLDYKEHLSRVREYLGQFKNCQCVGRSGSFRYANQDYALEMGMAGARAVLEGREDGMESLEREQEYGEGFRLPER
jgi:protoporphyrinogen oxidase